MNIIETFKTAIQSLKGNKIRSLLTMLGIIIGISSVIVISMIGKGSQQSITGELVEMADKTITINVVSDTEILKKRDYITVEDIENIKKLDGVEAITPSMRDRVRIVAKKGDRSRFNMLQVTSEDFLKLVKTKMLFGRVFTQKEMILSKKVILIDDIFAMRNFGRIDIAGQEIELEMRNGTKQSYLIVGVFEHPMKEFMNLFGGREFYQPYIPYTTFQKNVNDSVISSITVSIEDINQKDNVTATIIDYLEKTHNKESIYELTMRTSPVDSFNNILKTLSLLLTAVAAISLLVGGIGVMNIMLVSVTERVREIGIRKALGAKKNDILMQFLIESVVLTLLGGIIGLILGIFISNIVGDIIKIKPLLDYVMMAVSIAVSGGLGILFGTYPAKKAADLNPIDALRHE
ncbi:MAG: FtsX-like permease family protein [Fusobacteria bacterium]|jgi:putative ABC transport system permease protein|nr:FtsX-like permease family protein [Fusobacteriota bacterium]